MRRESWAAAGEVFCGSLADSAANTSTPDPPAQPISADLPTGTHRLERFDVLTSGVPETPPLQTTLDHDPC
jgi:hypothetical protein